MQMKTVLAFAMGIMFHHGAISGAEERLVKIGAVLCFIWILHDTMGYLPVRKFILGVTANNQSFFSGMLLFLGCLCGLETVLMCILFPLVPERVSWGLQQIGGVLVAVSLVLMISSLWVLSSADVSLCVFIDQGVYAYIRHPYYLGVGLAFVGCSLYLCNVASVVISFWVLRERVAEFILAEEEYLLEKHRSYEQYKKRIFSGIPIGWLRSKSFPDVPMEKSLEGCSVDSNK
ncbi:hypothetical protein NEHOM01_1548 [Nematocida homosporus]|uniref:uncharacterized protein n=1 Tax=Nematocida homosporus TaxID=1912981 RepID=UPI0022209E74|nr:uncharacterized protein NEHOM01_1548 [Nematocida homosporus]KAI5186562.1 hypothetical protein NEHOM01_1548 [Nematocida homosporus]